MTKWTTSLLAGLFASFSFGSVAYDSFGPRDSFDANDGLFICGTENVHAPGSRYAARFTSLESGQIDSILMPLTLLGGTNAVRVQLWSDANGVIGDRLVDYGLISGIPDYPNQAITTINCRYIGAPVILSKGSTYWIEVLPDEHTGVGGESGKSTGVLWQKSPINPWITTYSARSYNSGYDWWYSDHAHRFGAYRIEVGNVPGPVAVLPLLAGLAVTAIRRRKR